MLPFQFVWQTKTGPLLAQMQHLQNDPTGMQNLLPQLLSAFGSALPVLLICLVPVTFFSVCWQFTLPLIIDKQMAFGDGDEDQLEHGDEALVAGFRPDGAGGIW